MDENKLDYENSQTGEMDQVQETNQTYENHNQNCETNQTYENYNQQYNNMHGTWQAPNLKKEGNGFGIASFVLGLISLLLFCACVNWLTAILAITFGIIQLLQYRERGFAIAGIITAGLSLVLWIIMVVFLSIRIVSGGYQNIYDYYENNYDDNYYHDFYDDNIFDEDYYYDGYGLDDVYSTGGEHEFMNSSRIYF